VKYAVIHANAPLFRVQMMCAMLGVSRSGYYAWRDRKESARAVRDRELSVTIAEIYEESRGIYGSPRVYRTLGKRGISCSRKHAARLMAFNGLMGIKSRRYKASRVTSRPAYNASPNLIERKFDPSAYRRNQAWIGDITEIPTGEGVLYLAIVLCLRSREIVGWSMRATRDTGMIVDALRNAVARHCPGPGLIFHSDQGSQYASEPFRAVIAQYGFIQSMSRKGNCWDNAPAESFFATMKLEIPGLRRSRTRADAEAAIFEYLAVFYNRQRLHSSIGYQVPASVDQEAA
jgi:putative transposase